MLLIRPVVAPRAVATRQRTLAVGAAGACLLVAAVFVAAGAGRERDSALLSWSNAADDGAGVLGGQQHGVTQTITSCDADDPACTFQSSPHGYLHGQWVSNLNTESDRHMEVHVRSDLRQGSSYEDDIGEGPLAGMHKTDEKGVFKEWTPRPTRFREREFSRVAVGVPDADGMDSWEKWRKEHPNRIGHGNLPAHPRSLPGGAGFPVTDDSFVFRGPLSQPREVAPVDQDYDMTDVNTPLQEPEKTAARAADMTGVKLEPEAASVAEPRKFFVKDGVEYEAVPVAGGGVPAEEGLPAVSGKDAGLLAALHKVVKEMHASEDEYGELTAEIGTHEKTLADMRSRAAAAQDSLKRSAQEEMRIISELGGDLKSETGSGAQVPAPKAEGEVSEEAATAEESPTLEDEMEPKDAAQSPVAQVEKDGKDVVPEAAGEEAAEEAAEEAQEEAGAGQTAPATEEEDAAPVEPPATDGPGKEVGEEGTEPAEVMPTDSYFEGPADSGGIESAAEGRDDEAVPEQAPPTLEDEMGGAGSGSGQGAAEEVTGKVEVPPPPETPAVVPPPAPPLPPQTAKPEGQPVQVGNAKKAGIAQLISRFR